MLKNIKESITAQVSPTAEHLSELRGDFRSRLSSFKKDRSVECQQAVEDNFVQVLQAWGIENESAIPGVITALRMRLLVFLLPILASSLVAAIWQSAASALTFFLVSAPCLFGLLATQWRISILGNRQFIPFPRWIFSLFGYAKKRP